MGLLSGFSGSSSRITPMEFHDKVRLDLRDRGLSHRDIEQLESVVSLSINESGIRRGLDQHEVDQAVAELHRNRDAHQLSDHQISIVKDVLEKHL